MRSVRVIARAALPLIGAVLLLAACASSKPKPQPLEPLTAKIAGREVWNRSIDNVKFPLTVVALRDSFIVADGNGTVLALEAQTGRELWRGSADTKLSAGVGSDGRFAAVVTRELGRILPGCGWRAGAGAVSGKSGVHPHSAGQGRVRRRSSDGGNAAC